MRAPDDERKPTFPLRTRHCRRSIDDGLFFFRRCRGEPAKPRFRKSHRWLIPAWLKDRGFGFGSVIKSHSKTIVRPPESVDKRRAVAAVVCNSWSPCRQKASAKTGIVETAFAKTGTGKTAIARTRAAKKTSAVRAPSVFTPVRDDAQTSDRFADRSVDRTTATRLVAHEQRHRPDRPFPARQKRLRDVRLDSPWSVTYEERSTAEFVDETGIAKTAMSVCVPVVCGSDRL